MHRSVKLGFVVAMVAILFAAGSAFAQSKGNTLVSVSLFEMPAGASSPAAATKGDRTVMAIQFAIEPGYHIYWLNPGESGQPPEVQWALPAGSAASKLRWPTPERIDLPGGIYNFGYEGTVTLFATVTAESNSAATGGESAIRNAGVGAKVRWLVCNEDECLPGSVDVKLLPGGSISAEQLAIARESLARLPVDSSDALAAIHVDPPDAQHQIIARVEWKSPPSKVDWFPAPANGLAVENAIVTTAGNVTTIRADARRTGSQSTGGLMSVLGYTDPAGKWRGVNVNWPAIDRPKQ